MWSLLDPRAHDEHGVSLTEHRRAGKCGKVRCRTEDGSPADVELHRSARGTWRPRGVVRCQTWQCPTCAHARARTVAATVGCAIERHRRGDALHDVWLLTLTMPHRLEETQRGKIGRLFDAWDRFTAGAAWRAFRARWRVDAVVRCYDDTFGGNGLHCHFHVALFVSAAAYGFEPIRTALNADERKRVLTEWVLSDELRDAWADACRSTGIYPTDPKGIAAARSLGVDLAGGEDAAAYVVKWGLSDELAMSTVKRGGHFELLDAFRAGDVRAGELYREWADATRGRNFATGITRLSRKLNVTSDDVDAYLAELRRRRDAELRAAGVEPPAEKPAMMLRIRSHLFPAAVGLGWRIVAECAELAEERGESPQDAVRELLIAYWTQRRTVDKCPGSESDRGPPPW